MEQGNFEGRARSTQTRTLARQRVHGVKPNPGNLLFWDHVTHLERLAPCDACTHTVKTLRFHAEGNSSSPLRPISSTRARFGAFKHEQIPTRPGPETNLRCIHDAQKASTVNGRMREQVGG